MERGNKGAILLKDNIILKQYAKSNVVAKETVTYFIFTVVLESSRMFRCPQEVSISTV